MRSRSHHSAVVLLACVLTSCDQRGSAPVSARDSLTSAPAQQWRTERTNVGDTTIVRTVGAPPDADLHSLMTVLSIGREDGPPEYIFGAVGEIARAPDGSILLLHRQASAVRYYDSTGRFIRTVGRQGRGPGEYTLASSIAISGAGSILIWDSARRQVHVFSSAGEYSASMQMPRPFGIQSTGAGNLLVDTADNTYVLKGEVDVPPGAATPANPPTPTTSFSVVKVAPDGRVLDTLELPRYGLTPPMIERVGTRASRGGQVPSRVRALLPFFPSGSWALSPLGYFVASHGDRYAVDLLLPSGGVTRIERDIAAVPITAEERGDAIAILESTVQRTDASYRYNCVRHAGEGRHPFFPRTWIPAFAGMTAHSLD